MHGIGESPVTPDIVRLPAALVPIAWAVNRDPVAILRTA